MRLPTPAMWLVKRASLTVVAAMIPVVASAATTYRYIGPDFTMISGAFVAGDHMAGLFTTASPLAPNLVNVDVTAQVLSYRFSDGVNEYRSTDPNSRIRLFNVTTDAFGAIVGWHLIFDEWESGTTPHAPGDLVSTAGTSQFNGDAAEDTGTCMSVGTAPNGVADVCDNLGAPLGVAKVSTSGTWELSVAAPAPALSEWGTAALLGVLATIALVGLRRRDRVTS